MFGDLVALGLWGGGTADLGLVACRHTPLACKLKLITLSFYEASLCFNVDSERRENTPAISVLMNFRFKNIRLRL